MPPTPRCGFDAAIAAFSRLEVPLEQVDVVQVGSDSIRTALSVAREGDLGAAEQLLGLARRILGSVGSSEALAALFESTLLAAEAYVLHRRGRPDDARSTVLAAMATDEALLYDDRLGAAMHSHLVQLGQNLLRIAIKADQPERAEVVEATLIRYLEEPGQPWPWLKGIRPDLIAPLAPLCRSDWVTLITAEARRSSSVPV